MATPTYTESEIKDLVLRQANNIKGIATSFVESDADDAYGEACMEVGFEVPLSTDTDKNKKNKWLIERMRRWFLGQLWMQYALRFKMGDVEAQGITKNLEILCGYMDKRFEAAKAAEDTAHLFTDSTTVYGEGVVVVDTGLIDDRVGQSLEERE